MAATSVTLPPTAGGRISSGTILYPSTPTPTAVGGSLSAALPLQQRTVRVIRCSPTSSLRIGTPAVAGDGKSSVNGNPTYSFRLATPLSSTPKVLWPETPTPVPMAHTHLSFGITQTSVSESAPSAVNSAAPLAPASQHTAQQLGQHTAFAAAMPQATTAATATQACGAAVPAGGVMQFGPVPGAMQVLLPSGQVVAQAPHMMMPGVQMVSPDGSFYQPYQPVQGGYMAMPGALQHQLAGSPGIFPGAAPAAVVDATASAAMASATTISTQASTASPTQRLSSPIRVVKVSLGSGNHDGTGKCNPCAWFWKPKGCQSGASCDYCHLCPEGELKNRKKAKIAAIKMGAIEPAKPKQGTVHRPANLKLNALL